MSFVSAPRDVRVTPKASLKAPFVAPDMAPVPTTAIEQERGKPGWTNRDVKPERVNYNGGIVYGGTNPYGPVSVGVTVIRKASNNSAIRIRSRYLDTGPKGRK